MSIVYTYRVCCNGCYKQCEGPASNRSPADARKIARQFGWKRVKVITTAPRYRAVRDEDGEWINEVAGTQEVAATRDLCPECLKTATIVKKGAA